MHARVVTCPDHFSDTNVTEECLASQFCRDSAWFFGAWMHACMRWSMFLTCARDATQSLHLEHVGNMHCGGSWTNCLCCSAMPGVLQWPHPPIEDFVGNALIFFSDIANRRTCESTCSEGPGQVGFTTAVWCLLSNVQTTALVHSKTMQRLLDSSFC